jgi:hypothetical protein
MQRYARVGTNMGGVAARMGANMLLGSKDQQKNAAQLAAALGGLKGPLMKVAQLISTIPDAIPPEYAAELAQLQNQAPAMGWPFVRRLNSAPIGVRSLKASASRPPPRLRSGRCIRRKAWMAVRSRSSCNILKCNPPSKPISISFAS